VSNDELMYYRYRAIAEAELAERATHPKVVAVHHELARAYSDRIGSGKAEERLQRV